jgi:hypothetical protein
LKKLTLPYVEEVGELPLKAQAQVTRLHAFTEALIESYYRMQEALGHHVDEIAVLKGEKKRPQFKPSRMNEDAGKAAPAAPDADSAKRPGSAKMSKTKNLAIDHECVIEPTEPIPPGSRFKGYRDVVVQDFVVRARNTRYRLACWQTPDGRRLTGQLPAALGRTHFGPELVSYILYQHHHCQVTQPLLREQLREWGVEISTGQIDAILCHGKERFHLEKDALLATGLAHSTYVTVDDTGSRHKGKNSYVTHIGNTSFAWFAATPSKSRINFLELLRGDDTGYRIDAVALAYMQKQNLARLFLKRLGEHAHTRFEDAAAWERHLDALAMVRPRHRKIATEGALLARLQHAGLATDLAIVSDDAQQFNVLTHGLCWVHAERLIHKLLPLNEAHREDIARVRAAVWSFYADLKAYKRQPDAAQQAALKQRFETIFTQHTGFATLNDLLRRLHRNKTELLLVLERPDVPLHTNGSEADLRDHVKKQKVSGGTRSDLGQQCRTTFSSLKKTCRKLGISFWAYLTDRISCSDQIPPLSQLVEQHLARVAL